ncbi:MAG: radical SAM protein, partial [Candidatus Omnitrophica bacterium]|nr:radical SAM protein [Candidatus Omnitrophota bacterium]
VREIVDLTEQGFNEIFYRDELFTLDRKRVFDICQIIIAQKIKVSWICSVKASTASYELLKIMKEAGCRLIRVGVESGVQKILDNVNKDITLDQVRETFNWARKLDIETHAHLMLGMPGETDDTVKDTFNFIRKIKPSTVTYGVMTPYPGAQIYKEVVLADPDFGSGTHIDARTIHTDASFSGIFTNIPQRRLEKYVRKGYMRFYLRPGYIGQRILKIRDVNELRRLIFAGTQVFNFVVRGDQ